MKEYTVIIQTEEWITVSAENAGKAKELALSMYDPTAIEPEVVDCWRENSENDDE